MHKRRGKQKNQFGMLFWLAIVLLVIIIFLSNRKNIDTVLRQTNIVELFQTKQNEESVATIEEATADTNGRVTSKIADAKEQITNALNELEKIQLGTGLLSNTTNDNSDLSADDSAQTDIAAPQQTDTIAKKTLYFISVDTEGNIIPTRVVRTAPKSAAPMTQSIHLLFQGLTDNEMEDGLLNLIPQDSALLSASIKDKVAYLNFNEEFRFNPLGTEGITAQIKQIIYSVTEFNTIDKVQIMINGETVEYLNSESTIYLGEPIGRDLFG